MDFRYRQQRRAGKITTQLAGVGGFTHQIEFVIEMAGKFGDDFVRLQAFAVGPQIFHQRRAGVEQCDIVAYNLRDTGAQYFDGGFPAVMQFGQMHLRDGSAGERCAVERAENFVERFAVRALNDRHGIIAGEWRHLILQPGEFVGDVFRQQIAPRGQDLPELDENRPQRFQCAPQPNCTRLGKISPKQHDAQRRVQPARALVAAQKFVEAEAQAYGDYRQEAEEAHGGILTSVRGEGVKE